MEDLTIQCLKKLRGLREKYGNSIWTRKTIHRETRGIFQKHGGKAALTAALDELTARGYIRSWQGYTGDGNHRPTTYYELRKDEKMMKRICPIMALSNSSNGPAWCIEERCAWCRAIPGYPGTPEQYVCAILEIAARLHQLNGETLL